MGRHRRSAPETTAVPPEAAAAGRHRGTVHRAAVRRRAPVRTGLLGVSAAMAMGAVAVASGLLPGNGYDFGGSNGSGERVRADGLPSDPRPAGSPAITPADRAPNPPSRGEQRSPAPSGAATRSPLGPSSTPSPQGPSGAARGGDRVPDARDTGRPAKPPAAPGGKHRAAKKPQTPQKPQTPRPPAKESSAEAQVLSLVNQERAKAGCRPVTADRQLADLAQAFSEDMAIRGFFDHTDPDGASPWDRADELGLKQLGGENIARGQADARSVMESWMNSSGHRANILNCDYKTMGVGAHFAEGGPWWTQDFGF
ncbi:CAP domain-containing protein [Streptomyces sp. H27-D2]|uniref:CAP domain-containing protein n=1 Tax=Streptomyces sp. H27-D2 TaxID=3046304 RepID=UPI002DB62800|nr:CAP domain-containing protein [Streptomyces sp. H27-D2]MEC4017296.1 CAP domain-containing protein [Streptomyces sp. H27-D2]